MNALATRPFDDPILSLFHAILVAKLGHQIGVACNPAATRVSVRCAFQASDAASHPLGAARRFRIPFI